MERLKNRAEDFYREIRKVEIYFATTVKYTDQYENSFPNPQKAQYIIDVEPESFRRNLILKKRRGNYFTSIDLSFLLLDLRPQLRNQLKEKFDQKNFAVVLTSNTEKMMLGNDREPLTIDLIDNIKDNNRGLDHYSISISGETILSPTSISI